MITSLLALAPVALMPQFGVPLGQPDTHRTIAWPAGAGWRANGDFEQFVVANLTHLPDAGLAILRDGRAFLLEGMTSIAALTKFDDRTQMDMRGPVGNLAVFPHAGAGGRGMLLSTDFGNGLVCHEHDDTATPGVNDFISTTVSSATEWKRANCMTVGELASGSFLIVAGKESTVVTYTWQAGTFTAGPSLTNPSPVRDVLVCNYDGVGDPEIVVVGDDIRAYDLALTATPVDTIALDAIAVEVLAPVVPGGADVLAIAHDGAGTPRCELWIDGAFQHSADLTLPLVDTTAATDLVVTELSGTDWNDDGLEDLVVRCTNVDSAFVLLRDSSGLVLPVGYSGDQIDRVQPMRNSVGASAVAPAAVAFAGAGHERNVMAISTGDNKGIGVVLGPQPTCTSCPTGTVGALGNSPIRAASYTNDTEWRIFYEMPAGLSAEDYDYLQIATWKQVSEAPNPAINPPVIETEGTHLWAPITGIIPGTNYRVATVNVGIDAFEAVEPPTAAAWGDTGPILWSTLRFIAVDENDDIVDESGALHLAWRCKPAQDDGVEFHRPMEDWTFEVETGGLHETPPYGNGQYPGFTFGAVSIVTAVPETSENLPGRVPPPTKLLASGMPDV